MKLLTGGGLSSEATAVAIAALEVRERVGVLNVVLFVLFVCLFVLFVCLNSQMVVVVVAWEGLE